MSAISLLLPAPEAVQKLLAALIGKPVTVKKGTPSPGSLAAPTQPTIVGVYTDDHDRIGAVAVYDLAASCYVGAALMLMPPETAAECVKSKRLTETTIDNIREVLNVCAGLYQYEGGPHVRLRAIYPLPGKLPEDVLAGLARPGARLDLEVAVRGYGTGKVTLLGDRSPPLFSRPPMAKR